MIDDPFKLPTAGIVYVSSTAHRRYNVSNPDEYAALLAFYRQEVSRGAGVTVRIEEKHDDDYDLYSVRTRN